jgi:hypothetical protein
MQKRRAEELRIQAGWLEKRLERLRGFLKEESSPDA